MIEKWDLHGADLLLAQLGLSVENPILSSTCALTVFIRADALVSAMHFIEAIFSAKFNKALTTMSATILNRPITKPRA